MKSLLTHTCIHSFEDITLTYIHFSQTSSDLPSLPATCLTQTHTITVTLKHVFTFQIWWFMLHVYTQTHTLRGGKFSMVWVILVIMYCRWITTLKTYTSIWIQNAFQYQVNRVTDVSNFKNVIFVKDTWLRENKQHWAPSSALSKEQGDRQA